LQVLGELTITQHLINGVDWANCLLGAALFVLLMGIIIYLFLKPYPIEVGLIVKEN